MKFYVSGLRRLSQETKELEGKEKILRCIWVGCGDCFCVAAELFDRNQKTTTWKKVNTIKGYKNTKQLKTMITNFITKFIER